MCVQWTSLTSQDYFFVSQLDERDNVSPSDLQMITDNIYRYKGWHTRMCTQEAEQKSNPRSDRIWTWFTESPGSVISKYLQWDSPQVIHKQLFCGDNRQACHIRSLLLANALRQEQTVPRASAQTHPRTYTRIHIQTCIFLSPSHTNTPNLTHTRCSFFVFPAQIHQIHLFIFSVIIFSLLLILTFLSFMHSHIAVTFQT